MRSYLENADLSPNFRRAAEEALERIEGGPMSVPDLHRLLAPFDAVVHDRYTSEEDWNLANYIVGTIVPELGRATGGAFTRAIHQPEEREDSWLQSFGRGILDVGGIVRLIETAILDMFGEGSAGEYWALTGANSDHYRDSHPDAYGLGELAGTGLLAAATAGIPLGLAATNLGRMGAAGAVQGLTTGVDWATDADDWQTALNRFLVGSIIGGVTGKYTGLGTSFGTNSLAGLGHGLGMDLLSNQFPKSGAE